jgi:hypothetical protein
MKADFLKECHSEVSAKAGHPVALNDLMNEFCRICQNKDCGRSAGSNSLMFNRAVNWQNRLFINVKQDVSDPKYDTIRSKWFKQEQISVEGELLQKAEGDETQDKGSHQPVEPAVYSASETEANSEGSAAASEMKPEPLAPVTESTPQSEVSNGSIIGALPPIIDHDSRSESSKHAIIQPDSEHYLDDGRNETVIKPGGSFTFGD